MGYSFLEFMKRIGIFIVCAQSILHFTAGKSYEKYVKLLIGIMVLGQFIVPVRALFIGSENAQIWETVERFQREMETALAGTEISYEDVQVDEALSGEVKSRLKDTALKYGYAIEKTDISKEPPKIVLILSEAEKERTGIKIDKISIDITESIQETKKEETEETDSARREMLSEFAACLGTEESYMDIRIR